MALYRSLDSVDQHSCKTVPDSAGKGLFVAMATVLRWVFHSQTTLIQFSWALQVDHYLIVDTPQGLILSIS
ncbi:hypothetical protein H920_03921 [Fukomys damarensis]|uniref:Uncharacterized protein n=1 Tax=Fukomys damarensis TaxID=885580 RepID=A0A091EGW9_FUKDA|nr:hypothetical protein H920_03921 [Fukomys damarensis]